MGLIYVSLILGVAVFVFARGGLDEKIAITILVLGSAATLGVYAFRQSFVDPSPLLFVTDSLVLGAVLALAYRSSRFWPLPVASLQIASFLALLTPLISEGLLSYALGVAQGLWAYPQMALIIIGTVRRRNRMKRMTLKCSSS